MTAAQAEWVCYVVGFLLFAAGMASLVIPLIIGRSGVDDHPAYDEAPGPMIVLLEEEPSGQHAITASTAVVLLGRIPSRRRQAERLFLHSLVSSKRSDATTTIGQAQDARQGLRDIRGPNTQDTGVGQIPPVRDNEDGQP